MLKDCTGREIKIGDYIRHSREPLPPKNDFVPGVGHHMHNFYGVKRVRTLFTWCVEAEDAYVSLGSLIQVIDGPICNEPYLEPLRAALQMAN